MFLNSNHIWFLFLKCKTRHHQFKNWLSKNILISKSCTFVISCFNFLLFVKDVSRIWRVVTLLIQKLLQCEKNWKTCCLKKQRNCKICHFYVVKLIEKWLFEHKFSLKNWQIFFFCFKLWQVPKCWFQKSTRCKKYGWKTCFSKNQKVQTLSSLRSKMFQKMTIWTESFPKVMTGCSFFYVKIWHVVKNSNQNQARCKFVNSEIDAI